MLNPARTDKPEGNEGREGHGAGRGTVKGWKVLMRLEEMRV